MSYLSTIQPFPFQESVVDPTDFEPFGSYFPVELDIDEVFEWMYRVKTWKLNMVFDCFTDYAGQTINYTIDGFCLVPSLPTVESDMSCTVGVDTIEINTPIGVVEGVDNTSGITDFSEDANVQIKFQLFQPQETESLGDLRSMGYRINKFLPSILLEITIASTSAGISFFSIRPDTNSTSFRSINLFGNSVNLALVASLADPFTPVTFSPVVLFELLPHEYWEFDPGDGDGPVWDSVNGNQLRDPFSIP